MDSIDSATASVEVQCMLLCVHQWNGGWDHSHNMDEWVVERKLPNASKANSKHQTQMHTQCKGDEESMANLEGSKGGSVHGRNLLHLHRQTSILNAAVPPSQIMTCIDELQSQDKAPMSSF